LAVGTGTAYNLTVADIHTYHVGASSVLVHNDELEDCRRAAEAARDAATKPDGRPDRKAAATWVGGYKDGQIAVGRSSGHGDDAIHAEDDLQMQLPGAKMTQPSGWRTNRETGQVEWTPIKVCTRCQGRFPPDWFPPDVKYEPGGPWDG
jgi:hypothetical protein